MGENSTPQLHVVGASPGDGAANTGAAHSPRRRRRPSSLTRVPSMNITSAIDLMTVILIYLLMSASSDPFSIKENKLLALPRSASNFPALYTVPLQVNKREITVDGRRALLVRCSLDGRACTEDDYSRDEAMFSIDPIYKENRRAESLLIEPLREALEKKVASMREQNLQMPEEIRKRYMANEGAATIVADRDMPFRLMAEVVYTTAAAQLGDIRFAVIVQGGE
jgi:biopolymer transport protein TolR